MLSALLALTVMALGAGVAFAVNNVATTNHNDWTTGAHDEFGNPDNTLDNRGDLDGTTGNDYVPESGGWDWINAKPGADELHGGGGMDVYYGNDGDDDIRGDIGHDHLYGDAGDDIVNARDFSDTGDENGNIEETWGTRVFQAGNSEYDNDVCKLDADPDGSVVNECETLVISATTDPVYNGDTPVFDSKNEYKSYKFLSDGTTVDPAYPGNVPSSKMCAPGTYNDVNSYQGTPAQSPGC